MGTARKIYGNSIPLLRRIPVLRFLIPFVAGIISSEFLSDSLIACFIHAWILLAFCWLVLLHLSYSSFRTRHHFGILLQIYFLVAGAGLSTLFMEDQAPGHYTGYQPAAAYQVRIISSVQEKKKSYRLLAEVEAVKVENDWCSGSGKMMVYLKKDTVFGRLKFGDRILFKKHPDFISHDSTQLAARLSLHRQIFSRVYLSKAFILPEENRHLSLMALAIECRTQVAKLLMQQFRNSKEAAIAVALLVGEEVSIDDDLTAAYSATGTLHVLSVSGMHVGLIYLLLGTIFKPLSAHNRGKHLYYPLVMICVWCYAFIAGAAPSIIRASAMCTFFLISKWMDRKNLGIGALGASMFFLLMVNPFNIYEPGLQLSLFAVWGIIWLQQPLLRMWVPANWLLLKIWEMTCVSLAAQTMTLPVSLYYFGQFPNYFLLANVFVIPLTTACIYTCILQLLLTPVPYLQLWLVRVNECLLKLSNYLVLEMKTWKGAISYWEVDFSDMIFLYFLLFIADAWVKSKNFRWILLVLAAWLLKTAFSLFQLI